MPDLELPTAALDVPEEAVVGVDLPIAGSGFLSNAVVSVEVIGRSGSFGAQISTDGTGSFSSAGAATPALTVLTSDGTQVAEDETVTIDEVTYTFKEEITEESEANEVLIGEFAADTLANLKAAINLEDGSGTLYSFLTNGHLTVRAVALSVIDMQLVSNYKGTIGNDTVTTTTAASLTFSGDTLSGGAEANNQSYLKFSPSYDGPWTIRASDELNTTEATIRVWKRA